MNAGGGRLGSARPADALACRSDAHRAGGLRRGGVRLREPQRVACARRPAARRLHLGGRDVGAAARRHPHVVRGDEAARQRRPTKTSRGCRCGRRKAISCSRPPPPGAFRCRRAPRSPPTRPMQIVTVPPMAAPLPRAQPAGDGWRQAGSHPGRALRGALRQELRELTLFLVLGLPFGVAAAGVGGYALARGALTPVHGWRNARSRSLPRGSTIGCRSRTRTMSWGASPSVFNETLGGSSNRSSRCSSSRRRVARAADAAHGYPHGRRGRPARSAQPRRVSHDHRQHARRSRSADLARRSPADAVARRSGPAHLQTERVDLRELADDVAAHLGVLAEENGQSIVVEHVGPPRLRSRPAGAAPGADQSRRQRDQVQSADTEIARAFVVGLPTGDARSQRRGPGDRSGARRADLRALLPGIAPNPTAVARAWGCRFRNGLSRPIADS